MVTPWTGRVKWLANYWTRAKTPEYRTNMAGFIERYLKEDKNCTVLDAGCGTGITYSLLPPWAQKRYIGIDFTKEMVEYCRLQHPDGDFRVANILHAEHVPEADLVVTQNVLQHIKYWKTAAFNLIQKAREAVIFCERSHVGPTKVNMWKPVLSWCFNEDDMIEVMAVTAMAPWHVHAEPRILGRPRDTENRRGVLTIYMMRRP